MSYCCGTARAADLRSQPGQYAQTRNDPARRTLGRHPRSVRTAPTAAELGGERSCVNQRRSQKRVVNRISRNQGSGQLTASGPRRPRCRWQSQLRRTGAPPGASGARNGRKPTPPHMRDLADTGRATRAGTAGRVGCALARRARSRRSTSRPSSHDHRQPEQPVIEPRCARLEESARHLPRCVVLVDRDAWRGGCTRESTALDAGPSPSGRDQHLIR